MSMELRLRGDTLAREGRIEEALACYLEAAQWRNTSGLPEDPDLLATMGKAQLTLGQAEQALDSITRAQKLRAEQWLPPDGFLALEIARLLAGLARHEEALAAFEAAEQVYEQLGFGVEPEILRGRGAANFALGRCAAALVCFDAAGKHAEAQGQATDPGLLWLIAQCYNSLFDPAEACAQARRALELYEQQGLDAPLELREFVSGPCAAAEEASGTAHG